ncbi:MAG: type III secretion system chaperone [Kiritimatiellae bacterium]|nr:type III secretion system chaperone [Kiritimatiellia bacterium]
MPNREDYDRFLAEVRKETGIGAMTADESGLVTMRVDDKYNVNLQFVEATGRILCFVEVATLPADAPKEVYRDLLAGGLFGKDTAGGYFTLEAESESVVYNYFFDLETAAKDVDDFVSTLEKILQLCDTWCERINSKLSDPASHGEGGSLLGEFVQSQHIIP